MTQNNQITPSIVSVGQALWSMRNAPYSTESALAELIDNSIQAKADYVSVIVSEETAEISPDRSTNRLSSIAVFDNGDGMDAELIQNCLGVGFSRNKHDPEGLGKFGYGMLIGSLSQCFRIEVYSWKKGQPINFVYIDLDELLETGQQNIPAIETVKELPLVENLKNDEYLNSDSGTLVVLSKLDRNKIRVKTANGLYQNMARKLGRIYRHFLDDCNEYGEKRRLEILTINTDKSVGIREVLLPNDPLYQLIPNTLPVDHGRDFSKEDTNMPLDDVEQLVVDFEKKDKEGNKTGEIGQSIVEIRSTFIKPEVREFLLKHYPNAGDSLVGKAYNQNLGISFVRAAREIKLDKAMGWVNTFNTTERWWGIEIRFKPELDEIFGVSADKQHILNIEPTSSYGDSYFDSADTNLSIKFNIELNNVLDKKLAALRKLINKSSGNRGKNKKDITKIENKANEVIKKDETKTKFGEQQKEKTEQEKIDQLKTLFEGMHPDLDDKELEVLAKESLSIVIDFIKDDWPGTTFLDHKPAGKGSAAVINVRTKFYQDFYRILEEMDNSTGENALKLLLMAFIRTEDELAQRYDQDGELFDTLRNRWGHWVEELMPLVKD